MARFQLYTIKNLTLRLTRKNRASSFLEACRQLDWQASDCMSIKIELDPLQSSLFDRVFNPEKGR